MLFFSSFLFFCAVQGEGADLEFAPKLVVVHDPPGPRHA